MSPAICQRAAPSVDGVVALQVVIKVAHTGVLGLGVVGASGYFVQAVAQCSQSLRACGRTGLNFAAGAIDVDAKVTCTATAPYAALPVGSLAHRLAPPFWCRRRYSSTARRISSRTVTSSSTARCPSCLYVVRSKATVVVIIPSACEAFFRIWTYY